jgi:hypothetical protein
MLIYSPFTVYWMVVDIAFFQFPLLISSCNGSCSSCNRMAAIVVFRHYKSEAEATRRCCHLMARRVYPNITGNWTQHYINQTGNKEYKWRKVQSRFRKLEHSKCQHRLPTSKIRKLGCVCGELLKQ